MLGFQLVDGRFPDVGRFTAVSSGSNHSCALHPSGAVTCRGSDVFGESSPPPNESFESVTLATISRADCREADSPRAGESHYLTDCFRQGHKVQALDSYGRRVCGITTQGAAYCWGRDADSHTIADPDARDQLIEVAAGGGYTCYLLESGSIRCAGTFDQMLPAFRSIRDMSPSARAVPLPAG